ncbi:MAG: Ppx/GppA family phosphatase [Thermoleophilaceae bacterium]|nr:Ppx/GppA family phosphatase [Thermoleophilaceae bacterium]
MSGGQRIAVADLGTNSTRLLVADLTPEGELVEVDRLSEVTRLGQGVDSSGRLAEEAMERVHDALARCRELADIHGAGLSVAVATSAVRDAANGEEFREAVRERSGFDIQIIPGEEEARLTFLGATAGRSAGKGSILVIDIGGGSTEYVVGKPGAKPAFDVSTRLGSVRQTERHLTGDPPPHQDLEALAAAAREIVAAGVPSQVSDSVEAGVAVAGTATSLAAIDQELEPYDAARVDGYELMLGECERMLARLAAMPLERRREVPGLHPDRAPTIVAGAVILVESMRAFGLEHVEISEADILHGVALDHLTSG